MNSLTLNKEFKSPLEYISKLVGNSFEKFLTRKLIDVSKNIDEIQVLETEHLKDLISYKDLKINDLIGFEKDLLAYGEIIELFKTLGEFIVESKSNLDKEDQFYNELVLLQNKVQKLSETLNSVTNRMSSIHNKTLVKSSEYMSSDVLMDVWKEEEELWDDFYIQSKTTKS